MNNTFKDILSDGTFNTYANRYKCNYSINYIVFDCSWIKETVD